MARGGNERCIAEEGSLGVYIKFREAGDERQEKAGTQREQRQSGSCSMLSFKGPRTREGFGGQR